MTLVLWSLNFDETSMMNDLGFAGDCKKPRPYDCFLNDVFSSFFLHWQQKEGGRYVYEIRKEKKRNVCFMLIKFLVVCCFYNNLLLARYGVDDPLPPSSE